MARRRAKVHEQQATEPHDQPPHVNEVPEDQPPDPNNLEGCEDVLERKVEALKLIGDWSKWSIAVETGGVVGVLAIMLKLEWLPTVGFLAIVVSTVLCLAAGFFAVSIYFASLLLVSLPNVAERIHNYENHVSVWYMKDKDNQILRYYGDRLLNWFLAGMASITVAVVLVGGYFIVQAVLGNPKVAPAAVNQAPPAVKQAPVAVKN